MESLWTPPEQAGWLSKRGHAGSGWNDRFFVLKGEEALDWRASHP